MHDMGKTKTILGRGWIQSALIGCLYRANTHALFIFRSK